MQNATRRCERCSAPFEAKRRHKRFCSEDCRKREERRRYLERVGGHKSKVTGLPCQTTLDLRNYVVVEDYTDQDLGAYRRALANDPCPYCGDSVAETDHLIPRSRGGTHDWDNLVGACKSCNREKRDRTLVGFLLTRRANVEIVAWTVVRDTATDLGPPKVPVVDRLGSRSLRTGNGHRASQRRA